ncbi:hypothetical protein EMIT0P74_50047 [Pseudomonas sp. IT-P74]
MTKNKPPSLGLETRSPEKKLIIYQNPRRKAKINDFRHYVLLYRQHAKCHGIDQPMQYGFILPERTKCSGIKKVHSRTQDTIKLKLHVNYCTGADIGNG